MAADADGISSACQEKAEKAAVIAKKSREKSEFSSSIPDFLR